MKLNKISLKDKKIFSAYLGLSQHRLAAYSFENIYIWRGLFDISWAVIRKHLCVFFRDKTGCFMYLPPLGEKISAAVLAQAFGMMRRFNPNPEISRIENVEEGSLKIFERLGCAHRQKFPDYLCRRDDLAQLEGGKFKSKRSCCNYFSKHYDFKYLVFSLRHKKECLTLYERWADERLKSHPDRLFAGMLKDSRSCLGQLLDNYKALDFSGRVVKIGKEIKAFSFGYRLNKDVFCILFEVADLAFKGIAQFIFRKFSCDCGDYQYINMMDDSGLVNLKETKLSYHPELVLSYSVYRRQQDE